MNENAKLSRRNADITKCWKTVFRSKLHITDLYVDQVRANGGFDILII